MTLLEQLREFENPPLHPWSESSSQRIAPNTDWTDMGRNEHFVQFYESDEFIVNAVAEYFFHGLKTGEICIAVGTSQHLQAIESLLTKVGEDVGAAVREGRFVMLDCGETLSLFMAEGMPDKQKFNETIGSIVRKARQNGRSVRIFGEMVAVLWAEGNFAAVERLENLWNELQKDEEFSLFCAYPSDAFRQHSTDDQIDAICGAHSRVIPDESYTLLSTTDERLRKIAQLQQRTVQLEAEVERLTAGKKAH